MAHRTFNPAQRPARRRTSAKAAEGGEGIGNMSDRTSSIPRRSVSKVASQITGLGRVRAVSKLRTIDETSELLSVSKRTVRRPIESGALPVHKVARAKDPQRSRITNGSALLPGIDGRGAWVRRAKDLLALHMADLGGDDNVSEAERALVRRAVTLIIELERREVMFAQAEAADDEALAIYQTTVNTLRRTLESLGLRRRPRDVGPTLGQILREGQRDL
jgi:excisionase family DNA binding protein